jgi:error-prone DNA polymerase
MSMLPRLRPRCFYDLVIEVAIVRPGPIQGQMVHPYLRRRNGEEPVTYPDEKIRQVLGKTLGIPLFQEQAMALAVAAAGFTPGQADQLRRDLFGWQSHRQTVLDLGQKLIEGMTSRGYPREFGERCFAQLQGFSAYGFPESHAASFALLVYVSAWLKRYYPAAFAAALINSQPMGFYAPAQIVRDAREHGVEIRPIDVNFSHWDCTLEFPPPPLPVGEGRGEGRVPKEPTPALRLGFRLVQGLSHPWADALAAVVASRGPFHDVESLWLALSAGARLPVDADSAPSPRRAALTLRRLAAADAFRSMGLTRQHALWQVRALQGEAGPLFDGDRGLPPLPLGEGRGEGWTSPGVGSSEPSGQAPACAAIPANSATPPRLYEPRLNTNPPLPPISAPHQVAHDYAAVGLSLKAHPISFLRRQLDQWGIWPAARLRDMAQSPAGAPAAIAGLVLVRQRPGTAGGVVFMTIEDETGVANLIIRPSIFARYRSAARHGMILLARGRIERQGIVIHLLVDRIDDIGSQAVATPATSRDFH